MITRSEVQSIDDVICETELVKECQIISSIRRFVALSLYVKLNGARHTGHSAKEEVLGFLFVLYGNKCMLRILLQQNLQ